MVLKRESNTRDDSNGFENDVKMYGTQAFTLWFSDITKV